MRRAAIAGIGMLLTVGLLATPALAGPRSFTVIAVPKSQHFRPHHRYVAKEELFSHGTAIGHDVLRCKELPHAKLRCSGRFAFRKGVILAKGKLGLGRNNVIPIVGGSGAYKNAKGKLRSHDLPHNRTRLTFRVS